MTMSNRARDAQAGAPGSDAPRSSFSVAELRAVAQPPEQMQRRSGEHWAGRLYMRALSPYLSWLCVRMGIAPNQVTAFMIVCGVLGGAVVAAGAVATGPVGGLTTAAVGVFLIQLYLLLDCSDGEVARWTGKKSVTGIYLDRIGNYFAEAALLVGLGVRAQAGGLSGDWVVLGLVAALGAILIKIESDLVDAARSRFGMTAATEEHASLGHPRLGTARRLASATGFHRIVQPIELSLLILAAAIYDTIAGGILATRVLVAACAVVAAVQLVLHLVSILLSRRLRG